MQNTKNIKIISALYEKILAEGDFEETVEKLLAQYSATMVAIQQNEIGDFFLRNDKNIISSISVADIIFDEYLGKWNYRAILKVKT